MPIQILPARLANQIAAGEVVERPASVIKELVENALDAGATKIDIEIEKGGSKLIRIRDNGCGIVKDELTLALSRHATSKVSSFDDLENITSLGFRGEALASISSVARLKLTSRPAEQTEAWQAYAEGRDMAVKIIPAAHPQGTTIEVVDLFFNTPARRKFLRTEKTEFYHIDELIKRIALSRFDVQFTLQHNGKMVRQFRQAHDLTSKNKRLGQICGRKFVESSIEICCEVDEVSISGWICLPHLCSAQADVQYSYVNGRMMRDKLINHAIRQAYGQFIDAQLQASFVLYLRVDPKEMDVNVHPAKHEVRFHQARLIHDFIVHGIEQGLSHGFDGSVLAVEDTIAAGNTQITEQSAALDLLSSAPVQNSVGTQSDEHSLATFALEPNAERSGGALDATNTVQEPTHYHHNDNAYRAPSFNVPDNAGNHPQGSNRYSNPHARQHPSQRELRAYHHTLSAFSTPIAEDDEPVAVDAQAPNYQVKPLVGHETKTTTPMVQKTLDGQKSNDGLCLTVLNGYFALYQSADRVFLLDLTQVSGKVAALQYYQGLIGQPLLLPVKLSQKQLDTQVSVDWLNAHAQWFSHLGIEYECLEGAVIVRKVPAIIRQQDVSACVVTFFTQVKRFIQVPAQSQAEQSQVSQIDGINDAIAMLYSDFQRDCHFDLNEATLLIAKALEAMTTEQLLESFAVEIALSDYIERINSVNKYAKDQDAKESVK